MGLFDAFKSAGDFFGSILGIKPADRTNPFSAQGSDFATQLFRMGNEPQREINQNLVDILRTGGVGSYAPAVRKMEDNARLSLAQTLGSLNATGASRRLAGTPFQTRQSNELRMLGEHNIGQIGPEYAKWFLSMFGGQPMSQLQTAVTGATGAAGAQAPVMASQNQAYAQLVQSYLSMIMKAAEAAGGAAAGPVGGATG